MFGWKPQPTQNDSTPIPLCYGLVEYNLDDLIKPEKIIYLGARYANSLKLHEAYANKQVKVRKVALSSDNQFEVQETSYQTYHFKQAKLM